MLQNEFKLKRKHISLETEESKFSRKIKKYVCSEKSIF